jgi:hypothetical protein
MSEAELAELESALSTPVGGLRRILSLWGTRSTFPPVRVRALRPFRERLRNAAP